MKIAYTLKARQDLIAIYEYISYTLSAPDSARDVSEKIMEMIRTLESMPERNPLYKEEPWHSLGIRFMPVLNYLVFYTVDMETDVVSISRIMYGARDISRQLEETTEW